MAEAVRATGVGEVFVAEDPDSLAEAIRAVLADPERYTKAYDAEGLLDGWSWEAQAEVLRRVYDRLGVRPAAVARPASSPSPLAAVGDDDSAGDDAPADELTADEPQTETAAAEETGT
jgi:hypothetical protein